jgi:predicted  nucleic acid-binding Zn-ribbon protein
MSKVLAKYACDKCGCSWHYLYDENEARENVPCPECEKRKNKKKPFYSSKFFFCGHIEKSKGCGFRFASNSKFMFLECPNCKVNQAKREAESTAVRGEKGRNIMLATELAYGEAQKQGFSDMQDSGMRQGDIAAPPLQNAVTFAMEKMKMNTGWTGGEAVIPGMSHGDVGGNAALQTLQNGLMSGNIPDMIKTANKIV